MTKKSKVCAFCLKENLSGEDKDTNEWIVYVLPLNIFKQTYLFENYLNTSFLTSFQPSSKFPYFHMGNPNLWSSLNQKHRK